ncbi:AMP-binding protein [Mycobacterium sp.]|uniref:AMP-binding protein n=1 Tax=Mycobacterium sp. TaxID=1785 RepID=UPI002C27E060|nr:AMP-binding protein [Mycobacterium sp.]HME46574.1 AMP-binding protein [Mycobacterium sp.]
MHYADVIEGYADRAPDAIALVHGETRRTWAEFEDRAARLAGALQDAGLAPGSKVGLLLYNGPEYYEAFLAALKARMVPINLNYRYVDDELVYLLEDSDAEALVFHASLGETVGRVAERVPALKLLAEVDDGPAAGAGAERYEEILARSEPAPRIARRHDDEIMIYTGGTTGMPKGVVYDVGDWTDGLLGLVPIVLGGPPLPDNVEELTAAGAERIGAGAAPVVMPCSPLMHTAGLNSVAVQLAGGRTVTLPGRSLDPDEIWSAVERESVNVMIIVGDVFARPMLTALEEKAAAGGGWDLASLGVILSSGLMWSAPVKQGLLEHVDATLIDGIGATEGAMGVQISRRGDPLAQTGQFIRLGETKLFSEDGREIEPGSDEPGLIAAGGKLIPKGYYKDPEKSARVFREIGGQRYAFIGDWGRLEADGTLVLLGRGSGCINTAGEKVYPEEVEEVIKTHPDVADALVVGIPDERFGQRVTAVVAPAIPGTDVVDAINEYLKERLAGYKRPRVVVQVDAIKRAANGKPDYGWARDAVRSEVERASSPA